MKEFMLEQQFEIMIINLIKQFEESTPLYYYFVKGIGFSFCALSILIISIIIYGKRKNLGTKFDFYSIFSIGICIYIAYSSLTYNLPNLSINYGFTAAEVAYPNEVEKKYRDQSLFNNSQNIGDFCCVFKLEDYRAARKIGKENYAAMIARYLAGIAALERDKNMLQN